jgi:hypothetical protein
MDVPALFKKTALYQEPNESIEGIIFIIDDDFWNVLVKLTEVRHEVALKIL